jgi:hypothetical protein
MVSALTVAVTARDAGAPLTSGEFGMPRKPSSQPQAVCCVKITLRGIRPPIWRRLEVPANTRLDYLHLMIQAAMGWTNSHLHSFTIGEETFGTRDPDGDFDCADEKKFRLDQVIVNEEGRFHYTYDFGDDWEHVLLVEKISPAEPGVKYPRCLAGARTCPPEDVGGTPGYTDFLEALRDPTHEEHAACVEWRGSFDPEAFDLTRADAAVKSFKLMQMDMM